ncbi:MAG: tRNA lysidine(34) synthetase TilS [Oscillospiraceae bacterium]
MTIIDFIKENVLLSPGDRVLCAVSGGADSMCLLHYLSANAQKIGITVCAASFDHMLRGEASASDCRFVAEWCKERGIECLTGSGDVRACAKSGGMSEEEAARSLRYEFLADAAKKLGCNVIATAHNANDNSETLLFNLTRGGGLKGLCGIPPRRGNIVRPLLGTTRREIEAYNAANGIEYVSDATNESDDYTRNVIRHHVTPVLEGINPAFFEACARTMRLLREDEECLNAMAQKAYDEHYGSGTFPAGELMSLPKPVAMRVLRLICGRALSSAHAQAVYDIAPSHELKYADISGMRVTCDRGTLYFGRREGCAFEPVKLNIGTVQHFGGGRFEVKSEIIDSCGKIFGSFNILYFNYDGICGSISLTSRMPGDKIRLRGRGCTKSLKELFSEAKLSSIERAETPVLRDEKGVIAVCGFGVAERCIPRPGDKVIRVTINKTKLTGDN